MKTIITQHIKNSISIFAFLLLTSWAMAAAPTITVIGSNPIKHQVNTPYTDLGATAVDENGTNITSLIQTDVSGVSTNTFGLYMVKYSVTDGNGNTANATRMVEVTDMIAPTINTLIGSDYIEICVNDLEFVEPQVTAIDNYFPTVQLTRSGSFNITALGLYQITYTATDAAGNTSSFTRTIKVIDCTSQSTGIEGINNQIAKVYPNPTTNKLSIELKYNENYTATLYSINGKAVITQNINTQRTDLQLTDLAKGLYTLQLIPNAGGSPINQKVIIK